MNILAVGDVIGSPGRRALNTLLPQLRKEYKIDIAIVNAENAAGGIGVTPGAAQEMLESGADVLTSGNHIWAHKEIYPYLDSEMRLLRPLNYPPGVPGHGYAINSRVMVVNIIGRTFIGNFDCPFRAMDKLLAEVKNKPPIIVVDFHAEATSEKVAMGRYLDGRVSAVLGTHTHVGTIDTQILPGDTAYVTDIGMTGPSDSIIGDDIDSVIERFLTALPHRLTIGRGKISFTGILLDVDELTGKARNIVRINREVN
jgi:2',3'-cyclic-nucleotide 2'-phosphodiesterase